LARGRKGLGGSQHDSVHRPATVQAEQTGHQAFWSRVWPRYRSAYLAAGNIRLRAFARTRPILAASDQRTTARCPRCTGRFGGNADRGVRMDANGSNLERDRFDDHSAIGDRRSETFGERRQSRRLSFSIARTGGGAPSAATPRVNPPDPGRFQSTSHCQSYRRFWPRDLGRKVEGFRAKKFSQGLRALRSWVLITSRRGGGKVVDFVALWGPVKRGKTGGDAHDAAIRYAIRQRFRPCW